MTAKKSIVSLKERKNKKTAKTSNAPNILKLIFFNIK